MSRIIPCGVICKWLVCRFVPAVAVELDFFFNFQSLLLLQYQLQDQFGDRELDYTVVV